LFELIFWDFGGGFAAAEIPENSECGKREKALEKINYFMNCGFPYLFTGFSKKS
jgi:hypothetical protein